MALSRSAKLKTFLAFFCVLALVGIWQTARYYYYRGWAKGTKTGTIRKVAYKGPPYCKYIMGEMIMQQGNSAAQPVTWEFSIDSRDENDPIAKQLQDAEKSGKLTTLQYRQDLNMWWRCAPTEYFVVGVEK